MRLALSSAAAPDLALDALIEGAVRRGFAALELVLGDAHGVGPALPRAKVAEQRARIEAMGATVAAVRVASLGKAASPAVIRLASALGAAVVAPFAHGKAATTAAREGGMLLVAHPTEPDAVQRLRTLCDRASPGSLGLAWDMDPTDDAFAAGGRDVLDAAWPFLRHIRLHGGGPESMGQEGRGIGALMARLALRGYTGALALAPSDPSYRIAWARWIGRRGGWRCGSKTDEPSLVTLDGA